MKFPLPVCAKAILTPLPLTKLQTSLKGEPTAKTSTFVVLDNFA